MEEHDAIHVAVVAERVGLLWEAREVQTTFNPPECGHLVCGISMHASDVIARGLTENGTVKRAIRAILRHRAQARKDELDRAASEALGG